MKTITALCIATLLFGCNTSKNTTTENTTNNPTERLETPATVIVSATPKMSEIVSAGDVKETVSFLASNDLNGRNTGSEGIAEAADYVETQFKTFGLKPYFDTFRDNFKVGELEAFNVVGLVEGNDSQLKNEYIVIGAHYDHIGSIKAVAGDSIANGANDNAAGTSAVLAMAKHFGKNKTNKRSLIFVTFTAEEMGLLGSKHLAEKLKAQNINLYTMVNFEMIGVPFIGRDYEAFITGYELSNLAEKINDYAGTKLVGYSEVAKKYNLFKRSDNYAFYEAFKVPSHTISSCDLTNFDFYHHVDDEIDKLNYSFMANLINKMAPVLEAMANAPTQEIKMNDN
ncbi:M28 family peptidase [Lacinutrix sp. Hel_I_90]|uniref:M28 family metallopeptidase n=1 Tax=Lacinutrix sp. Hel_I_90 TaxID=1249999 RepID=UPI0009E57C50|nr:M28 family peptidase [Lacinutrix sp. Hel_I_90]